MTVIFASSFLLALSILMNASAQRVKLEVNSTCEINEDSLSEFIKAEFATFMRDGPVLRLLRVVYHRDALEVWRTHASRFRNEIISTVVVPENGSSISGDNIIAYFPEFNDVDNSGLAAGLLNLYEIFHCLKDAKAKTGTKITPRCRVHATSESGFNHGKEILVISDIGDDIDVFGKVPTLAFAVDGCSAFTHKKDGCLHNNYGFTLACYLPGRYCSGQYIDE